MTESLRLLTLNMHKGFSIFGRRFVLHELRDAIRDSGADVVLLQEVLGEHQEHSTRWERWPETGQYEFLADTVWQDFAYGKNAVYPAGHHGNAVLSRYPIVGHDNITLPTNKHEDRGALHAVIKMPDWPAPLHVLCTHLSLFERDRRRQVRAIAQRIGDQVPANAPVVLGGDFNDWRQWAHDALSADANMSEVFVAQNGKAARSFPVRFPLLRLDRLYTRGLQAKAARVLGGKPWTALSDHAPLQVELRHG